MQLVDALAARAEMEIIDVLCDECEMRSEALFECHECMMAGVWLHSCEAIAAGAVKLPDQLWIVCEPVGRRDIFDSVPFPQAI